MATYDSIHTGTAVDQAVERTLANKSKGNSSTPIYLDANGEAIAITKSTVPTEDDAKLITSGTMYTELNNKYNKADIATSADLGTSSSLIPSEGAVKTYTDKVFSNKQETLVAGDGISISNNVVSLGDTSGFMPEGELSGKRQHFSEELSVGYESEVLAKTEAASKSTFDRSKFTIVGSPVVTNDGIASGFSSSNYLTKSVSILANSNYTIKGSFTTNTLNAYQCIFALFNNTAENFGLLVNDANNTLAIVYFRNGSITIGVASANILTANTTYDFEVNFIGRNIYIKLNDVIVPSLIIENVFDNNTIDTLYVGIARTSYSYSGSIDLKQFSITVDGVPVFSGNKTGIDTVKPDDYTTQSNTVITADGILDCSTSSDGAVITPSIDLASANNFTIELPYLTAPSDNNQRWILRYRTNADSDMLAVCFKSKKFGININGTYSGDVTTAFSPGELVKLKVEFTGTKYNFYTKLQNGEWTSNGSYSSSQKPLTAQTIKIADFNTTYRYLGLFDLNSFKIYVDDNLIYQPCLKIPYTLAKSGQKIVDSQYRSRVEDEYNQAGYTPYYILQPLDKGNYAIVGNPTINSDFVASGFSSNTVIKFPNYIGDSTNWSISIPFKYSTLSTNDQYILCNDVNAKCYIKINNNNKLGYHFENNSGQNILNPSVVTGNTTLSTNTYYVLTLSFKNNTYTSYITNVSTQESTLDLSQSSSEKFYTFSTWVLGGRGYLDVPFSDGTIDLKGVLETINNELVYEAVISPNYTMQTVKSSDLVDSKVSGANMYRQYANQTLEQYGTCTSGTAVTFEKPFMDTNYVLSVPYSAKSKTGFTPTQTSSWKAKGKVSI